MGSFPVRLVSITLRPVILSKNVSKSINVIDLPVLFIYLPNIKHFNITANK